MILLTRQTEVPRVKRGEKGRHACTDMMMTIMMMVDLF